MKVGRLSPQLKALVKTFRMVLTLCYDAISKNISNIGMSPFIVFTISSATILPACLFILAVQDKVGRKALASGSLVVSGFLSVCAGIYLAIVESPEPGGLLVLAIIARLGINIAYNSGHQYAVELLPTVVRGQAVAVVHVVGFGATFFSTQILYLAEFWRPSPEITLGGTPRGPKSLGATLIFFRIPNDLRGYRLSLSPGDPQPSAPSYITRWGSVRGE